MSRPRLAAFGSSRIAPNDPRYRDLFTLAKAIGAQGWDGITGGHQGMMAAFSEGITAAGGGNRGITLARFPTPPDNTLAEEQRAHNFFDRMGAMIEQADAYIVLPGGLGTLAELAMTWDLLAIRVLEPRPLLLYGEMWTPIVATLSEQLILSTDHAQHHITHCRSHAEVLTALNAASTSSHTADNHHC